ncbi:hypothetical protein [Mesorhizobium sp. AR10]|uniref:hypothetical protein n=1 Tax=Mesorhizobium sp. AR10 TaxID=2865839 RepID=UPI00215E073B|nr:hypothetical protein [Mesorhizobium sp. AR10]
MPDKAETAFAAMLPADINVLYASKDMMAAGTLLAAMGAGKDVKIIGTDGLPGPAGGIEAVAKGRLGRNLHLPNGRQGSDRDVEKDPARLRHFSGADCDGGDDSDRG